MCGTAPTQSHWLFVEAPGSWGRDALASSCLSVSQREQLDGLDARWRVALVRRADRPLRRQADRMVWLSAPDAVRSWRLPIEAPVDPAHLGPGDSVSGELLFLCTNGGRDRCCAVFGRPLLDSLSDERIWECSHLGGHRFAPTGVRLRDRMVFGRLDAAAAHQILDGGTPPGHLRGAAGWPPPVQVAASQVWRSHGVSPIAAAVVDSRDVTVSFTDGTRWRVRVSAAPSVPRMLSCGAAQTIDGAWHAAEPAQRLS